MRWQRRRGGGEQGGPQGKAGQKGEGQRAQEAVLCGGAEERQLDKGRSGGAEEQECHGESPFVLLRASLKGFFGVFGLNDFKW